MQNILLVANASPYGSERMLSALRLSIALLTESPQPTVRLFFLSDAVVTAVAGQQVATPPSLEEMLSEVIELGGVVALCRTCVASRGLMDAVITPGVTISTMPQLAQWTLEADKVISF